VRLEIDGDVMVNGALAAGCKLSVIVDLGRGVGMPHGCFFTAHRFVIGKSKRGEWRAIGFGV
jgi:hypothetical protein